MYYIWYIICDIYIYLAQLKWFTNMTTGETCCRFGMILKLTIIPATSQWGHYDSARYVLCGYLNIVCIYIYILYMYTYVICKYICYICMYIYIHVICIYIYIYIICIHGWLPFLKQYPRTYSHEEMSKVFISNGQWRWSIMGFTSLNNNLQFYNFVLMDRWFVLLGWIVT